MPSSPKGLLLQQYNVLLENSSIHLDKKYPTKQSWWCHQPVNKFSVSDGCIVLVTVYSMCDMRAVGIGTKRREVMLICIL